MMNNHVIFATGRLDAVEKCVELGLVFEETYWVMNFQLLGQVNTSSLTPHFTDSFREMPAFREAAIAFDLDPDALQVEP